MRLTLTLLATLSFLVACAGPADHPRTAPTATTAASEPVAEPAARPGKASLADLEGTWTLVELPRGTPVPKGINVTITFEGTNVSGSSGCNSYSGSFTETNPGEIEPGMFSATEKFCEGPVMDTESAYLKALGAVERQEIVETRLEIGYANDEGEASKMVFVRSR